LWIDEQAHPGEHIAHLGPFEKRRRSTLVFAPADRRSRPLLTC